MSTVEQFLALIEEKVAKATRASSQATFMFGSKSTLFGLRVLVFFDSFCLLSIAKISRKTH